MNFRSGKNADRSDALSHPILDISKGDDDPRLIERKFQLMKKQWLPTNVKTNNLVAISHINNSVIPVGSKLFEDSELQSLRYKAILNDHKISNRYTKHSMKTIHVSHPA